MLGPEDALVLAPGVGVAGAALVDDVRGASYPVNETGLFVLERVGRPLEATVAELARHAGIDTERARADVLRFAFALNRELLANVAWGRSGPSRLWGWLRLAVRLVPTGMVPPSVARRSALDTSSAFRSTAGVVVALRVRCAAIGAGAAVLGALGRPTVAAVALAAGVVLGLAVHEIGHVAVLGGGVAAALVVCGLRTYVLHGPVGPARRRRVAAAGPAAAALLGVGAVTAAWLANAPGLAPAGGALAAHALGLTVATADGRAACGL
jgi:hypothetical protein